MDTKASFKADEYARIADELAENAEYEQAIKYNNMAAEEYQAALNDTTDSLAAKTLKLMYASRIRNAKELERKIILKDTPETMKLPPIREMETISVNSSSKDSKIITNESFMLLDKQNDPFEKFWEAVEGLVNVNDAFKLPLAFSHLSEKESEKAVPIEKLPTDSTMLQSYLIVPGKVKKLKTYEELEIENAHLKETVDAMATHIAALEKTAQEHVMLKNSVLEFREEFKANTKGLLEAKVAQLTNQNAVLEQQLAKYKERWDKLKDSAKRKKEQKMSSSSMYYSVNQEQ